MKSVIVLFGMTGAGKSTLASALLEKEHLRKIKTTTTRPPRSAEDVEYNFTDVSEFEHNTGKYVAVRKYNALIEGAPKDYYYGVDTSMLADGGLLITDFVGYKELVERGFNVVGVYIHADYETRLQRSRNRAGFRQDEFDRRNLDDMEKFKVSEIVELGVSHPTYIIDNSMDTEVSTLVDKLQVIITNHK